MALYRQEFIVCPWCEDEEAAALGEEAGDIYIARKIADRLRSLLPRRDTRD